MTKKQVSLTDVAKAVGLSKFSVSRALSGKDGVSKNTRDYVIVTAKKMGYKTKVPNRNLIFAFDLVVFNNADMTEFWMGVIAGAQKEAKRFGIHLVTRPIQNPTELMQAASIDIDGVIGGSGLSRKLLKHHQERGIKTVLISTALPGEQTHIISISEEEAAFEVGQHFKSLNHKALAFVTDRVSKPSFASRERGLKRFAEQEKLYYDLIEIDSNDPGRSFEHIFKDKIKMAIAPTALFCSTDSLAFAVIHALNRLGLSVPKDVSVIGVYNSYESSTSIPKLSSVDVPSEEIGKLAVRQLYSLVKAEDRFVPTRTFVMPSLIIRESTAKAENVRLYANR